jgi:hypothetical protein
MPGTFCSTTDATTVAWMNVSLDDVLSSCETKTLCECADLELPLHANFKTIHAHVKVELL